MYVTLGNKLLDWVLSMKKPSGLRTSPDGHHGRVSPMNTTLPSQPATRVEWTGNIKVYISVKPAQK